MPLEKGAATLPARVESAAIPSWPSDDPKKTPWTRKGDQGCFGTHSNDILQWPQRIRMPDVPKHPCPLSGPFGSRVTPS